MIRDVRMSLSEGVGCAMRVVLTLNDCLFLVSIL